MFPIKYRYFGTALSFSFGMGIVGGLTPLVASYVMSLANGKMILSLILPSLCFIAYIMHIKIHKKAFKKEKKLNTV